jgi:pyruvate kinase
MKGIIDRFEEDIAVIELENHEFIDINISDLPKNISTGDVIELLDGKINLCIEETKNKKQAIEDLMDELFEQ